MTAQHTVLSPAQLPFCLSSLPSLMQLGMGLTLTLEEITTVFVKQPQLLLLGMVLQYTVLPCIGYVISRNWGLQQGLAVGVALVSCMPGGTASNIMAYIAKVWGSVGGVRNAWEKESESGWSVDGGARNKCC